METMKTLPESSLDFLIELWLRSHNQVAVRIEKIPKEDEGNDAG